MNDDDNIELIADGKNDRAQQIEYTVLLSYIKTGENATRVVRNP